MDLSAVLSRCLGKQPVKRVCNQGQGQGIAAPTSKRYVKRTMGLCYHEFGRCILSAREAQGLSETSLGKCGLAHCIRRALTA